MENRENHKRNIPLYLKIPGFVFGAPILAFSLFAALKQTYLFPRITPWILIGIVLVACGIGRLVYKKNAHLFFWLTLVMVAYNFVLSLGGFTFFGIGGFAILLLPVVFYFLFMPRFLWLPVFMRLGVAFIVIGVAGIVAIEFERQFGETRCEELRADIDPVYHSLERRLHPYDFAMTTDPKRLVTAFGITRSGSQIVAYDLDATVQRPQKVNIPYRGVQRVTAAPDGHTVYAVAWGQWEDDHVIYEIDVGTLSVTTPYTSPGCRNAFEVVMDEPRNRFYLVCEVSHNVLAYEIGKPEPIADLTLFGLDSYDMILSHDGSRLYVTDWATPWLYVIDPETLTLIDTVYTGMIGFGVVEGPDGLIYVARPMAREVAVVDPKALKVIDRIDVGYGPRDLEVDPKRNLLFVGNYYDGTLDVIDLGTRKRISRTYAGRLLRGLYFDAETDRLYLATGCGVLWADVTDLLH